MYSNTVARRALQATRYRSLQHHSIRGLHWRPQTGCNNNNNSIKAHHAATPLSCIGQRVIDLNRLEIGWVRSFSSRIHDPTAELRALTSSVQDAENLAASAVDNENWSAAEAHLTPMLAQIERSRLPLFQKQLLRWRPLALRAFIQHNQSKADEVHHSLTHSLTHSSSLFLAISVAALRFASSADDDAMLSLATVAVMLLVL
jgi:hypothetical protein